MDVDGHPKQKHHKPNRKSRVVEPRHIIASIISEVSSLQVAVDGAHTHSNQHRDQRRVLATHGQGIDEGPAIKKMFAAYYTTEFTVTQACCKLRHISMVYAWPYLLV